jgi:glucose/arabinose dehydrogenase
VRAWPAVGRAAAAVLVVALAAGCGSGGYTPAGPFRPVPEGAPPEVGPPQSTGPAPAPAPGTPAEPGAGQQQAGDPNVVATGLAVPTGLVVLPDGTAVVGERDTGRLLRVHPDRSPAQELMRLPGLDTSGDGGLLGLAISPTFAQDGLLYAYVTTPTDNRVVRFPVGGTPNPVLTGIPKGATHNGGGLVFAPDGSLFVGTGDTGNAPGAQDPASLAGKVLHVDVFGRPVGAGGLGGPVYSRGYGNVTALCLGGAQPGGTGGGGQGGGPGGPGRAAEAALYATDDVAGGTDELDRVRAGGDGGWPSAAPSADQPLLTVPDAEGGPGGCAAAGTTVFVGTLEGQRVKVVQLDPSATPDEEKDLLTGQYGRLRTVVADPQGALWITTSNKDGLGVPGRDDDRVLRITPPNSSNDSPL